MLSPRQPRKGWKKRKRKKSTRKMKASLVRPLDHSKAEDRAEDVVGDAQKDDDDERVYIATLWL